MWYVIEAIHWEERVESTKPEFKHLFEKTDVNARWIKID